MRILRAIVVAILGFSILASGAYGQTEITVAFDGTTDGGVAFSGTYTLWSFPLAEVPIDPNFPPSLVLYFSPVAGELTIGSDSASANNGAVLIANDLAIPWLNVPLGADFWAANLWSGHPAVCSGDPSCNCSVVLGDDPPGGRLGSVAYSVQTSLDGWSSAGLFCLDSANNNNLVLSGEILHLAEVEIVPVNADAGSDQTVECTSPDGALVGLDGSASEPEGAAFTWVVSETGQTVIGVTPDIALPLGTFSIELTVEADGQSDTDTVQITVGDTAAPDVTAALEHAGESEESNFFRVVATAFDTCDLDPAVEAMVGAGVSDGGTVTIAHPGSHGLIRLEGANFNLEVTATDDSGNEATASVRPE
jgi:hypothetical protein